MTVVMMMMFVPAVRVEVHQPNLTSGRSGEHSLCGRLRRRGGASYNCRQDNAQEPRGETEFDFAAKPPITSMLAIYYCYGFAEQIRRENDRR